MKRIRKLFFQNSQGARWDLNGASGVYATALAGFGYSQSASYADLTRGFFLPTSGEEEPQGALSLTVVLTRTPYRNYQAFVDWIASAGTLTICYAPTETQEYWRDVTVSAVQKSELNQVGWLEIPMSFLALTPWYRPSPTQITMDGAGEDDSKRYNYIYDLSLRYGSNNIGSLSTDLVGSGHIPGALDLTYFGAITNPILRLTGNVSGKTHGICSIAATLSSSDRLEYSSRYGTTYVRKIAADGAVTDLLDSIDLTTTPFFRIPVDEICTLSLESGVEFSGSAALTTYYYYRSV